MPRGAPFTYRHLKHLLPFHFIAFSLSLSQVLGKNVSVPRHGHPLPPQKMQPEQIAVGYRQAILPLLGLS